MESELYKKMVDRINELAALAKQRPLTPEEQEEQQVLRKQYIAWFRSALRGEGNNN